MSLPQLLPCPFCGEKPKLQFRECEFENTRSAAQASIFCNMCRVSPSLSVLRDNGYIDNRGFKRLMSNQEALQAAIVDAARYWNSRV